MARPRRIVPADSSRITRKPRPRRQLLRALGGLLGCAWLAGLPGALGCATGSEDEDRGEPAPEETRFPLTALPPGERVRVLHAGRPVELHRDGDRVAARSLVCTHFACEVRWRPDEEVYACPCHEGRFAPDGRVLGGPPSRPLPEVPVRVEGSTVILGG